MKLLSRSSKKPTSADVVGQEMKRHTGQAIGRHGASHIGENRVRSTVRHVPDGEEDEDSEGTESRLEFIDKLVVPADPSGLVLSFESLSLPVSMEICWLDAVPSLLGDLDALALLDNETGHLEGVIHRGTTGWI